jgi:hypothetical protein
MGQAVPPESRARGGRPATGEAVPRESVRGGGSSTVFSPGSWSPGSYYYPGYYNRGYYNLGYWDLGYGGWGSGLGYYYGYSPLSWGWAGSWYGAPYFGYGGYGSYGGYGGYGGYGEYGGPGYGYGYTTSQATRWYSTGDVKLRVRPKNAEVFVDGYYVGVVDDFDGTFQHLTLSADPSSGLSHKVEIRAPGFEPQVFDVRLQPGQTITYRGDLQPTGSQPIR